MHMHGRNRPLDGAQNIPIEKSVKIAGQPSLDAHFRSPALPSLRSLPRHIFGGKEIRIGSAWSTAKSAKTAADETHVREIDVPVDHVRNRVADGLATQVIRNDDQRTERGTLSCRQVHCLGEI